MQTQIPQLTLADRLALALRDAARRKGTTVPTLIAELQRRLKVGRSSLSNYQRAEIPADRWFEVMRAFAAVTGTPPEWLAWGEVWPDGSPERSVFNFLADHHVAAGDDPRALVARFAVADPKPQRRRSDQPIRHKAWDEEKAA